MKEQGRREKEDGVAALMPGQYIIRITNVLLVVMEFFLLDRSSLRRFRLMGWTWPETSLSFFFQNRV